METAIGRQIERHSLQQFPGSSIMAVAFPAHVGAQAIRTAAQQRRLAAVASGTEWPRVTKLYRWCI